MIITRTVTKKVLENLVHETFTQFGNLSSSSLLDSLKLLGFYYATNAGISINIEDLKTRDAKKEYIIVFVYIISAVVHNAVCVTSAKWFAKECSEPRAVSL